MEEMEVPTEHLHETIEEEVEALEKKERTEERKGSMYIAISTALMAVFAALASLFAGHHADEAMIDQIKSSDSWSYYQAKGIKAEIMSISTMPGKDSAMAHYQQDQAKAKDEAEEEKKSSEQHLEVHKTLARAVTMFQIAIAISAIAILTKRKPLWYASLGLSAFGLFFFITGLL
jgi:alpha-galactosidase/6-phospho-beta-glucosidase family protein